MAEEAPGPARRSGRPKQVDRHRVALVALDLFERDGYDAVTMRAVAEAAGVSQRTLFREFPAKADLAWEGMRDAIGQIEAAAPAWAGREATLGEIVETVVLGLFRRADDPELGAFARRSFRVIATSPGIRGHASVGEASRALERVIEACGAAGDRPAGLVADALVGAAVAATFWWACADTTLTLEGAARVALESLSVG